MRFLLFCWMTMSAGRKTCVLPPAGRPSSAHARSSRVVRPVSETGAGHVDVLALTLDPDEPPTFQYRRRSGRARAGRTGRAPRHPAGTASRTSQRIRSIGLTVGWMLRTRRGARLRAGVERNPSHRQLLTTGLALFACGLGAVEQAARPHSAGCRHRAPRRTVGAVVRVQGSPASIRLSLLGAGRGSLRC